MCQLDLMSQRVELKCAQFLWNIRTKTIRILIHWQNLHSIDQNIAPTEFLTVGAAFNKKDYLNEALFQSSLSLNKKQTNPSRYGSDLSVLAPVTGLELTFELFASFGNFKKSAV